MQAEQKPHVSFSQKVFLKKKINRKQKKRQQDNGADI